MSKKRFYKLIDFIIDLVPGLHSFDRAYRTGDIVRFDDFDIDYNQYKYLFEEGPQGALTKQKAVIVVKRDSSK